MARCLCIALTIGPAAAAAAGSTGNRLLQYSEDKLPHKLVKRAVQAWPGPHAGLDRSTLGKLAGLTPSAQAAVLPAPPPPALAYKRPTVPTVAPSFQCPTDFQGVFADMGDGDMKAVSIKGDSITITPSGNEQKWVVKSKFDQQRCKALVDFKVPGKPGYPPVPVVATLWKTAPDTGGEAAARKVEFEFSDQTGTLAPKDRPLNRWVQLGSDGKTEIDACPTKFQGVFLDMKDKDMKKVFIEDSSMTIAAYDNTWVAKGTVDPNSCSANIDFNVPGKPNPPPFKVKTALLSTKTEAFFNSDMSYSGKDKGKKKVSLANTYTKQKYEFEFTDPSGKVADKDFPLNHWVQVFPLPDGMTMEDMMKGMDMKGMDMKDMKGMDMKSMDMKGMDMKSMDMKGMDI